MRRLWRKSHVCGCAVSDLVLAPCLVPDRCPSLAHVPSPVPSGGRERCCFVGREEGFESAILFLHVLSHLLNQTFLLLIAQGVPRAARSSAGVSGLVLAPALRPAFAPALVLCFAYPAISRVESAVFPQFLALVFRVPTRGSVPEAFEFRFAPQRGPAVAGPCF
jgi:hypothetical protein